MSDKPKPCPICRKPAGPPPQKPFCSERCRQVDLGRWFTESYAVPGKPLGEEDETE